MKVWRRQNNENEKTEANAVELDAARVQFFANIVNELRTPLSVILGQIDAALLEEDSDTRNHQLRDAGRNARRLERLAEQAMDLTRLDNGSLEHKLRNVELVPFVGSLVASFEDLADRNGLLLEFFAKKKSVRGRVDPNLLTTVVSNLMSNAVKFTPPGGRIGVALDFNAPDVMQISIVDTGVGIAEDRMAQIFEPFVRDSGDESTPTVGAGIGLALSRELARLHGGDITLRSQPGKGCRFDIELPVGVTIEEPGDALLDASEARPKVTAEILFRSTVQSLPDSSDESRPTVLLIDANDAFRRWAAESLAEVASVEAVATNDPALQLAREMLPDLVIADDRDKASDGVALTRHLRADERTSHIPVVLVSAQGDADRRIMAFDAGVDDYLDKPIDARELRARTASTLERHRELRSRFREQVVIRAAEICERSVDQAFLEKVTTTIESSIESADFSVQDLGDAVAMSTSQLSRKLRALIDQSPAQLIRGMRLQRAADLVAGNAGQISDICFRVGFSDQSHFSRTFKRHFGVSPIEYRRQHAGDASE
jgi:DNA-binding response OmpR family regulator